MSKKTLGRAIRDDFEDETGVRFQPLKWVLWIGAAVFCFVLWLFFRK